MPDGIKKCPNCGNIINSSHKILFCGECGYKFEDADNKVVNTKQCPYCGEEILATAKKCKHCGEMLDYNENSQPVRQISNNYNYKKQPKELPYELQRFNWGAFFLTWMWGLGNNSKITLWALVVFIPYIGWIASLPICIWFGIKGNEWAWRNMRWKNVAHFNAVQRNWVLGAFIWLLIILVTLFFYAAIFATIAAAISGSK